ncbi:helix-turn-helix domain-containing protein [Streptomyces sp. 7R007]
MGSKLKPLELMKDELETLLRGWATRRSIAQGLTKRAMIVLACAEGQSNTAVAARLGVSRSTVNKWRARFLRRRLDSLCDEPETWGPSYHH